MNQCPACYKIIDKKGVFCGRCTRDLFDANRFIRPLLDFNQDDFQQVRRELSSHLSISGVQDKISLSMLDNRLTPTAKGGTFILKPVPMMNVPAYKDDIPENEHLTMQIAQQVFKMKTAASALVHFKSGEPAYLVKRFDVSATGKIAQEDFCQLLKRSVETHGRNYKYDSSYEAAASVIKEYCAAVSVEMEKFYFVVLFSYFFANGDAHLKNFSLQQTPYKDYILSPAYDLMATSVHFPDEARTALNLFEEYESRSFKENAFYRRVDFLKLAEMLQIRDKRAVSFMETFSTKKNQILTMIKQSFLSKEAKIQYLRLFEDRMQAMQA